MSEGVLGRASFGRENVSIFIEKYFSIKSYHLLEFT